MKYPLQLQPSGFVKVEISRNENLDVPKATPSWRLWTGPVPGDTFGNKPIVDFNGRPAFAELAILWSFLEAGWDGVWVDTYGKRYLQQFWPKPEPQELPLAQAELLKRVRAGRPWDVFCWSPTGIIFAEAKRRGRDSIRESQKNFLVAALDAGVPLDSFLVVEWSVA